jgi:hypothetical protein
MKSPLRRLLKHYGSFQAAADALGVHRTTIMRWPVIPPAYALDVDLLDIGIHYEEVLRSADRYSRRRK